ncbi:MAG: hypothetical protein ACRYGK_17985 [Janthinobacterium lividum]
MLPSVDAGLVRQAQLPDVARTPVLSRTIIFMSNSDNNAAMIVGFSHKGQLLSQIFTPNLIWPVKSDMLFRYQPCHKTGQDSAWHDALYKRTRKHNSRCPCRLDLPKDQDNQ